jgi:hypothetical protein
MTTKAKLQQIMDDALFDAAGAIAELAKVRKDLRPALRLALPLIEKWLAARAAMSAAQDMGPAQRKGLRSTGQRSVRAEPAESARASQRPRKTRAASPACGARR